VMCNRRVRDAVWDWTVVVGNRVAYLSQVGRANRYDDGTASISAVDDNRCT
jgi:hypothetical protein